MVTEKPTHEVKKLLAKAREEHKVEIKGLMDQQISDEESAVDIEKNGIKVPAQGGVENRLNFQRIEFDFPENQVTLLNNLK